jgi:polysaccharide biosynthesis protein PslH
VRLLFLTDQFPFPPINGITNKTSNLLTRLAEHYRITLVSFCVQPPEPAALQRAQALCERVELLEPQPRSLVRSALHAEPPFASRYRTPAAVSLLRQLSSDARYDIAHFDTIGTMVLRDAVRGVPVTIGSPNDAYGLMLEGRHRVQGGLALQLGAWLGRSFERRLYRKFTYMHFVSPVDAEYARQLDPAINAVTVPLGIESTQDTTASEDADTLLFVANLSEGHAVTLLRFIKDVYPTIRASRPATKLLVVGAEPPAQLVEVCAADPSITMTGYVADLRQHAARGAVALSFSPQRSGMQTKVLLGMALGKPVIGLPQNFLAFEGARDGIHFVAASSITDIAQPVLTLLDDVTERRRIGGAARALIEQRYTWDRVVEQYIRYSTPLKNAGSPSRG